MGEVQGIMVSFTPEAAKLITENTVKQVAVEAERELRVRGMPEGTHVSKSIEKHESGGEAWYYHAEW